jgi:hypothetical protein
MTHSEINQVEFRIFNQISSYKTYTYIMSLEEPW